MYEAFYQLITDPFRISPDPGFSFQHRTYRKAMASIRHALHREEGFILITGQPGTGKTALVNDLLRTLMLGQTVVAKLISTQLTAYELLDQVAYSFNLDHEDCSKAEVLVQLERFLLQQYQNGRRSLLIVDEAQDMGEDALEELYLLSNLHYKNYQLLQIILIGPEHFLDTVIIPSLEQLHQRLFTVTLLEPLDAENTEAYIKHRLRCAGWMGDPLISTETYAMIQQYSHGIPRRINQICSCLFLHGSIEGKHRLGTADLRVAIDEFQHGLLMSMYKEGISEEVSWPAEKFEETYKEEHKKVLKCRHPCCYPQKPSARVVETRRYILVREPVSVVGPGIGHNQASKCHEKLRWHLTLLALFAALDSYASKGRSLLRDRIEKTRIPIIWGRAVPMLVLITITLVVYFGDGDSDQPVRYLEKLALNQVGTQPLEKPVTEDRERGSVQPLSDTLATEEQSSRGTRSSAGEAVSKTRWDEKIFAAPAIQISEQSVLELATMEVTHSVSNPKIKLRRIHAVTDPRTALGNELASVAFQQEDGLPSNVTQLEKLPSPAAGKRNVSTSDDKNTDALVGLASTPRVAMKEIIADASGVQTQETIIGNGPWFINLASLLYKANAEHVVEDLVSKGVAVGLYQVTVRGKDYWRVHVPGFATAAEANAKASLIKEKLGLKDAWVAKR